MGTLTIATFMTLDGVMQAPGGPDEDRDGEFGHGSWSFPHFSADMGEVINDAFASAEAIPLGRRTYEIFAASWPNSLVRIDGRYVLLYSGGWWESDGYATCDSPLGPCAKATTERPLHTSNSEVAGPGGACVITGPAGDVWLAHHAWTPGAIGYRPGGARSLHFAALRWDGSRLAIATTPAAHPASQ